MHFLSSSIPVVCVNVPVPAALGSGLQSDVSVLHHSSSLGDTRCHLYISNERYSDNHLARFRRLLPSINHPDSLGSNVALEISVPTLTTHFELSTTSRAIQL